MKRIGWSLMGLVALPLVTLSGSFAAKTDDMKTAIPPVEKVVKPEKSATQRLADDMRMIGRLDVAIQMAEQRVKTKKAEVLDAQRELRELTTARDQIVYKVSRFGDGATTKTLIGK